MGRSDFAFLNLTGSTCKGHAVEGYMLAFEFDHTLNLRFYPFFIMFTSLTMFTYIN